MGTLPRPAGNLPMTAMGYVPGETAEATTDYDTLEQAQAFWVPARLRVRPAGIGPLRTAFALKTTAVFLGSEEILEAVWAAAASAPTEGANGSCCGDLTSRSPTPILGYA